MPGPLQCSFCHRTSSAVTARVPFHAIGPVGINPADGSRATPVPAKPFHKHPTDFRPRSPVTAEPPPMTSAPSPRVVDPWIPAIILVGFILRLTRITGLGDLEFDEIVSLRYASLAPAALISQIASALFEHPPGYYLALGAWLRLAEAGGIGTTDGVVIRSLSVVIGTLTIPIAWGVARDLYDPRIARWAATAIAIAPLPVFYSREARMYVLATAVTLASTWIVLRAASSMDTSGSRWTRIQWVGYTLLTLCGATIHYSGLVALAGHLAGTLWVRHDRRLLWRGVAAAGAILTIAIIPWLAIATGMRATIGFPFSDGSMAADPRAPLATWPAAILTALGDMTGGPETPAWRGWPAAIGLVTLALIGVPTDRTVRRLWIASAIGGATVLMVALALAKPVQGRYLSSLAPLIIISAVAGMVRLITRPGIKRSSLQTGVSRWSGRWLGACLGTSVALAVVPFWVTYYGGDYQRADYRSLTRRISALEQPGDAVLLTGPWQAWYYDYTYDGGLWHTVLPSTVPPPIDPATVGPRLTQLASENRRLWFLQAGLGQADPEHRVEAWLNHHAWPVLRETSQNAVLTLFEIKSPKETIQTHPAAFRTPSGAIVTLASGSLDADQIHGGNAVRMSLTFKTSEPITTDTAISIRLVGPDGTRVSADTPVQATTPDGPGPGTSAWIPGTPVTIRRAVWVPPGTPVNRYQVRIVLYDPATLAPLPVSTPDAASPNPGQEAVIGTALITLALARTPYPSRAIVPETVPQTTFWSASDWSLPEAPDDPQPVITLTVPDAPGLGWRSSTLTLLWGTPPARIGPIPHLRDPAWARPVPIQPGHRFRISLRDARDLDWVTHEQVPGNERFGLDAWRIGEWQTDRVTMESANLPPGTYRVIVSITDHQGRPLRPGTTTHPSLGYEAEVGSVDLPRTDPLSVRLASLRQRVIARVTGLFPSEAHSNQGAMGRLATLVRNLL